MVDAFYVCFCMMVPKFAGLIYAGEGLGSALTYLLVTPANKLLADIITMQVLGWKISLPHADGHTRL